jgi:hypothetical protein
MHMSVFKHSITLGFWLAAGLLGGCHSADHAEQSISGQAQLSVELQRTLKPTAALYVIARRPGALTGPPLVVKRFAPPLLFPLSFSLSGADLMMPGQAFEGNLTLMARVSQSGAATPIRDGDIEGFAAASYVPVGTQEIYIELNQVRKGSN